MPLRSIHLILLTALCLIWTSDLSVAGESAYHSSRRSYSNRPTYAQKYGLYDHNRRSEYPLSTGKRIYGYNPQDYYRPIPRIERTRRPLGYPYSRTPYPYYYPYPFYYGFHPYAYYHFYHTPWYGHYNYRYYHDLYQPWYSTPYAAPYGY
ncbi:MAG: hypothetical protein KDA65_08980 [Planctomycetaceae bacterium]|nr:hypothetical protein [Planctomycetaceae bacterium]